MLASVPVLVACVLLAFFGFCGMCSGSPSGQGEQRLQTDWGLFLSGLIVFLVFTGMSFYQFNAIF